MATNATVLDRIRDHQIKVLASGAPSSPFLVGLCVVRGTTATWVEGKLKAALAAEQAWRPITVRAREWGAVSAATVRRVFDEVMRGLGQVPLFPPVGLVIHQSCVDFELPRTVRVAHIVGLTLVGEVPTVRVRVH